MDMLTEYLGGTIPIYLLIIIITALSVGAFVLGNRVQRIVHFIWPKDIFSLLIYTLCALDLIVARLFFGLHLFEGWFWLPVLASYLLGFGLSSIGCYIMLATPHLSSQRMPIGHIVPYWIDDKQYIQAQSNKALLKRLIFGVEHEIECNVRLEPNWEIPIKHPLVPIPTVRALIIDSIIDEDPELIRQDKWIKCIRFRTRLVVAPASMKNKLDMMMIENAHTADVRENIRLSAELLKVKQQTYKESMSGLSSMLSYAMVDASPGMQILNHIKGQKKQPVKEKKEIKE